MLSRNKQHSWTILGFIGRLALVYLAVAAICFVIGFFLWGR